MKPLGTTAKSTVLWIPRLLLSGIFIYAGVAKMRDPHAFSESVDSFRLLPAALVTAVTLTLPPLEVLAGILALTFGRSRRVGALALLVMIAVFLVALSHAQIRGLNVDCGCLGSDKFDVLSPTKNLWFAIIRDVLLGAMAWFLYASAKEHDPANESSLRLL